MYRLPFSHQIGRGGGWADCFVYCITVTSLLKFELAKPCSSFGQDEGIWRIIVGWNTFSSAQRLAKCCQMFSLNLQVFPGCCYILWLEFFSFSDTMTSTCPHTLQVTAWWWRLLSEEPQVASTVSLCGPVGVVRVELLLVIFASSYNCRSSWSVATDHKKQLIKYENFDKSA